MQNMTKQEFVASIRRYHYLFSRHVVIVCCYSISTKNIFFKKKDESHALKFHECS
jgi:hypothetical protein